MKELEEMTAAEISLAFAREVAGWKDCEIWNGRDDPSKDRDRLPDYANDWMQLWPI